MFMDRLEVYVDTQISNSDASGVIVMSKIEKIYRSIVMRDIVVFQAVTDLTQRLHEGMRKKYL